MSERGNIHVSTPLSNVAVAYRNANYIADRILPAVPVAKQADLYYNFNKEAFFLYDDIRGNRNPAKEVVSWSTGTNAFYCDKHSLKDVVTDDDRANADAVIDPETTTVEALTDMIKLRREYDVASALFSATTFSGYTAALSGTDQWSDLANSDPVGKLSDVKTLVRQEIGLVPNTLVIGDAVYQKLLQHPDIIERIKYSQLGVPTESLLATILGFNTLLVGSSLYNGAVEGQTVDLADIWGKYALACYIAPGNATLKTPTLGFLPTWKLNGGLTGEVKKYRDEAIAGDWIEVTMAYDIIVSCAPAGYLLSAAIA
jgi:hypothetical protein